MSELYGEQHRLLQQEFDTEKLADRVKEFIVTPEITDEHKTFIVSVINSREPQNSPEIFLQSAVQEKAA